MANENKFKLKSYYALEIVKGVAPESGLQKTAAEMRGTAKAKAKANAMRSAVVVLGALSFGDLTLRLGFKPYLEKAELEQQRREAQSAAASAAAPQPRDDFDDSFPNDGENLSTGLPESDNKL